jgi:hypothetical protein
MYICLGMNKKKYYDLEYPHRYDRFRTYTIIYVYNVNKIDKELKYLVQTFIRGNH